MDSFTMTENTTHMTLSMFIPRQVSVVKQLEDNLNTVSMTTEEPR